MNVLRRNFHLPPISATVTTTTTTITTTTTTVSTVTMSMNSTIAATNTKCNKKKKTTPESQFRMNLDQCTKTKDLRFAISLFDSGSAASSNFHLTLHHYNSLLYICSNAVSSDDVSIKDNAIQFGFKVYNHMVSNHISPNEATSTAMARLAAGKDDGDSAFDLAKKVGAQGRLRTYGPALSCFCRNGLAEKAYEVEKHMDSLGLQLEESELLALLKVSVDKGIDDKVYEYLHKLRAAIRRVSDLTMEVIECWFNGQIASDVGLECWDVDQVKEAKSRNGGGWHGLGWLGKGRWVVQKSTVSSCGRCCGCGQQLLCVDTDEAETERFSQSVASLAMEREVQSNFKEFQDWLEQCPGFEAVVDGANIGLYQQNFAEGGFSISQLDAVVKELYVKSEKWPLIVLHKKRVKALLENASCRDLLQEWINQGIIYSTPFGSNDDWYWLYAAVKLKCLLVTNDEMRDHIFELLGNKFFFTWKERHQVKYTFMKQNLKLFMPPSYSLVIQESENGSWHVPGSEETNDESLRTWLCITRPSIIAASNLNLEASELKSETHFLNPSSSEPLANGNHSTESLTSIQNSCSQQTTVLGKRREMPSSVPDMESEHVTDN